MAWARSTGLDIRLVVAGPPRTLPSEVVDELFGLAQQAIANIVAHADARTARVGLVYGADEVVLLIQDDGVGFDATELPRPDGSWAGSTGPGLPELSEMAIRTEHLGGTVQIDATPGWGTTIRAAVPYLTLPTARADRPVDRPDRRTPPAGPGRVGGDPRSDRRHRPGGRRRGDR